MSADATHIRYLCPFCDWDGPSPKSVKSHVSGTETGDHQGVNGYTMDRVIETTEDPSRLPMIDRIERAANEFDEPLTKDDADEVADAAKDSDDPLAEHLSRYMVLRIWMDNGRNVEVHGPVSLYYEDLTEKQKEAMSWMYHSDKSYSQISRDIGQTRNYCSKIYTKYSYMLQDKFISEKLKNDVPAELDIADIDTSSNNSESETIEVSFANPTLRALQKADVEHEVDIEIKDDEFDAITKLVKAGYEDIAEDLFKE
jgi:hypothetical protein